MVKGRVGFPGSKIIKNLNPYYKCRRFADYFARISVNPYPLCGYYSVRISTKIDIFGEPNSRHDDYLQQLPAMSIG